MALIIETDSVRLAHRGAFLLKQISKENVSLRGRFVVALSGGTTPRAMHRLFCEEPHRSEIPWNRTHIFWVDERRVPVSDPASNYGTARRDFLDRVPIPLNQVHPMPASLRPEEGAVVYEKEILRFFQMEPREIPMFDLVCLGIGSDGHTASLFPGNAALGEKERLVAPVRGGYPDVGRLTMTFPLLNHAREIIFLVSGNRKAAILKEVLEGPAGRFPAQMVQPVHGNLTWLLDLESASMFEPRGRASRLQPNLPS